MGDIRRNALADKIKRYDEAKKLIREWKNDPSAQVGGDPQILSSKVINFVQEYVFIMERDGQVAPYLGINLVEDILIMVLGRELRAKLFDLNLFDVVRVVQELSEKEDGK